MKNLQVYLMLLNTNAILIKDEFAFISILKHLEKSVISLTYLRKPTISSPSLKLLT